MSDEEKTEAEVADYSPVRIETLRPSCPFTFDLYVKVNEKYIHYVKKGDDLGEDRIEKFKLIEKLKEKDVQRLFVHSRDKETYNKFIDVSIEEVVSAPEMEVDERMNAISEIAQQAIEVAFNDELSREAFQMTEKAATGLRKVVQENPKALKNIFGDKKKSSGQTMDVVLDHCKNVAALAVRMAFASGFRGEDLDDISTAALMHDIGLTTLKKDEIDILFFRPEKIMSTDDKRLYQMHVKDGVAMLEKKEFVNPKIIALVKAHEETVSGDGYPERKKDMNKLEQILALCNCYEKKVTAYKMSPIEAFKNLQINDVGRYPLELIKRLKDILESEEVFSLAPPKKEK